MSLTSLHSLTISGVQKGLREKKFSALELVQTFFERIKDEDKKIGAYLTLHEAAAAREAEAVDLALAKGEELEPLAGVPMAIKDNILISGSRTTAGSKVLENYLASYDAGVIKKLKAAQAVLLGKTNLDEFAMGSSTENSAFQITRNPHDLKRVPGGSSGGSAAAVAAHLAVAALGSDTGGSIREPAGFCGVVGLKPTYGSVSRSGLIAMASSLDQIGPITKTVADAAILFETISGRDPYDATSVETTYKLADLLEPNLQTVRNLTIGLPQEYFKHGLESETQAAINRVIERFKSLKINFKEISLPHTQYALAAYYIIMFAEVSANLARFDGIRYARHREEEAANLSLRELYDHQRGLGFGPEVKRRIILGTFVLSAGYYDAYYAKAQKVRRLIKNDFDRAFETVDVILAPIAPTPAFKLGEKTTDPLEMYLSDIFTIPVNLAGLPAIAIPTEPYEINHESSKLPIGFQLIGQPFREADILGLGQYYEKIAA